MKRLLILGIALIGVLFLWEHRDYFNRYVNRDVVSAPKGVVAAEKSANRAKTRVNQTRAVDSGGIESIKDGMSQNDVKQLIGDPSSIENDGRGDVWIYDTLGRKITFRNGLVFSIDPI
jgi:hypothetical protein